MSLLAPAEKFTRAQVLEWFDAVTLAQGESCVDGVSQLVVKTRSITARVDDPGGPTCRVLIEFTGSAFENGLTTRCNCPTGKRCAHAAAVMLAAIAARTNTEGVSPGVLSWITDLRHLTRAVAKTRHRKTATHKTRLFYHLHDENGEARVRIIKGMRPDTAKSWILTERALAQPPQFVDEDDLPILRLFWAERNAYFSRNGFILPQKRSQELLGKLLASGRLVAGNPPLPLTEGVARPGWIVHDPRQQPRLAVYPPSDLIIPGVPPYYVDMESGWVGALEVEMPPELAQKLPELPPLLPRKAALAGKPQAATTPETPKPNAAAPKPQWELLDAPPRGVLRLDTLQVESIHAWRDYPADDRARHFDYAEATLCYGEARLAFDDQRECVQLPDGEWRRLQRHPEAEARLLRQLVAQGLEIVPNTAFYCFGKRPAKIYGLASEAAWAGFMRQGRAALEASGWQVRHARHFRHHYLEVDAWEADIRENSGGWLDLDMGVVVENRRLPLAPLLSGLFLRDKRWLDAISLANISSDEAIELIAEDETRLRVPAKRLKPLARLLIDLFDGYRGGPLRLSRLDVTRLDILRDKSRWQFHGPESILTLAERLKASQGVQEIAPPQGFRLALRDYQRLGLSWLQYLREHNLAGILADDMGLGKTAQTLAHLLMEKEAGRLTQPALIVLPTSLISNWKSEAARFAPDLKVLSLYGQERKSLFAQIPHCDMALTTYPLLWRDGEMLKQYTYHFLILDEAQTVKNARSKSAGMVRQIKARHRLCLTGTPLENHLGELWAQFDFLLPGFLGDSKSFTRLWRNPVEKQGNALRRELLASRLRPFILRRRKDDVATELPPKTVIVRTVELSGAQRDLYETVRAAMDEKIRAEIASRGFRRSQIVILDALLKLRQVCCDPRLVKSGAAKRVRERAKLDLLVDMLPELVDEGRRILVFSQFTAMLDLIQTELQALRLDYTLLTGDTKDRETAIHTFQSGKTSIFLISLKAGGVGLNLTAADTVIHYDPWWNPAVENQATDRAHRLGQDKPVFVYKLIVAGSIEEKILALQEQKAELAASILSEERQGSVKFSEADLAALFDPLPA
jgi:superfamily II DNA or RNA helicase